MRLLSKALLIACIYSLCASPLPGIAKATDARAGVLDFNKSLDSATRHMDNAATLALWENDGVSLLPSTPPIVGKAAITKFLTGVMAQLAGSHMVKFDLQCHDIAVSGNWASEWCTEHQVVQLAGGKPPFDGWGKMLLVLHRGADGKWRLKEEMWNQAVEPTSPTTVH